MQIRELYGMEYKSIELDHPVRQPMSSVLRDLADYLERNDIRGYVINLTTQSHPDDDDRFLTSLVWATN